MCAVSAVCRCLGVFCVRIVCDGEPEQHAKLKEKTTFKVQQMKIYEATAERARYIGSTTHNPPGAPEGMSMREEAADREAPHLKMK